MATAINIQSNCSEEEWKARQRLAACYRIFAYLGWDEMIFNHVTLKVPGEDDAFLINPYGLHFSEVTASSLVKIDIDGNTLDGSTYPVNKAGFTQHSLFHRELPDVHAIIHTHTTATMAVASLEGGLQPVNFYAAGVVQYPAGNDELAQADSVRALLGPVIGVSQASPWVGGPDIGREAVVGHLGHAPVDVVGAGRREKRVRAEIELAFGVGYFRVRAGPGHPLGLDP